MFLQIALTSMSRPCLTHALAIGQQAWQACCAHVPWIDTLYTVLLHSALCFRLAWPASLHFHSQAGIMWGKDLTGIALCTVWARHNRWPMLANLHPGLNARQDLCDLLLVHQTGMPSSTSGQMYSGARTVRLSRAASQHGSLIPEAH